MRGVENIAVRHPSERWKLPRQKYGIFLNISVYFYLLTTSQTKSVLIYLHICTGPKSMIFPYKIILTKKTPTDII